VLGGIPQGRITELVGAFGTSGKVTLALKMLASAQQAGDLAAWLDLGQTFDPDYAYRCGVDLRRLLLVEPQGALEALDIAHQLAAGRGLGLIAFDSTNDLLVAGPDVRLPATMLRRIARDLRHTHCSLVFLTSLSGHDPSSPIHYPDGFSLVEHAALRLHIEKEQWLRGNGDTRGYRIRVSILKSATLGAGKAVTLDIRMNGAVAGDGIS
jgi:recombination protein RecA